MSERELTQFTYLNEIYIKSNNSAGYLLQADGASETGILKNRLDYWFKTDVGNVADCSDMSISDYGLNVFKA